MPPFSLLGLSVPATLPERGPGAPSSTSTGFGRDPPARPNRNYLGRNWRRAARGDCNAARLERRSLVDENVESKSRGKYCFGSAPRVGARLLTAPLDLIHLCLLSCSVSANAWPRNVKATGFGLNDISVLSSSCDARSVSRDKESGGMGANARRSRSDEQVARMMMQ
jgi:hypothetical protein